MKLNRYLLRSTGVAALGGLLFGFDTVVISGTTAALKSLFLLTDWTLGITVASAVLGTVIGSIVAGIPGDKYWRRDSLKIMALLYIISALGCVLATSWAALICFRIIGGLAIGGSSVLGPMYIAEISPAKWRGRLVGFFQFNVVVRDFVGVPLKLHYWRARIWSDRVAVETGCRCGACGCIFADAIFYSAESALAGEEATD